MNNNRGVEPHEHPPTTYIMKCGGVNLSCSLHGFGCDWKFDFFQIFLKGRSKSEVMRSRKTSGPWEQAISRSLMTQREKCQWSVGSRSRQKGRKNKSSLAKTSKNQQPFLSLCARLGGAAWLHSKEGCRVPEKRFLQSKQADRRWPERSQMDSSCLVYTADISSSSNRETSFLSHYALFS